MLTGLLLLPSPVMEEAMDSQFAWTAIVLHTFADQVGPIVTKTRIELLCGILCP